MTEFGEPDRIPNLSMDLPPEQFEAALLAIIANVPGDEASAIYQGLLEESYDESIATDIKSKRAMLFLASGQIKKRRGNYTEAQDIFRLGLAESDDPEAWYLQGLYLGEASLLRHELDDPAASIEPYELAINIFENNFTGINAHQTAPDDTFSRYVDALSHLAGAYGYIDDREKVQDANRKLITFGQTNGAIFGVYACEHWDSPTSEKGSEAGNPIYQEIVEKLTGAVPQDQSAAEQIEGLRSLEELVNDEPFLPNAPEERDHVLMHIYGGYGKLLSNPSESEVFIKRALNIAKRQNFLLPMTKLYLALAVNQQGRGRSIKEQQKTMKKALAAAEATMDAGASAKAVGLEDIANVLISQLNNQGDYIGFEKIKRRLAERGFVLLSPPPGSMNPNLN